MSERSESKDPIMNDKPITWTKVFIFLQVVLLGLALFWILKFETSFLVRTILIILSLVSFVAAIFRRPYFLLLMLMLLGASISFNLLRDVSMVEWGQVWVFLAVLLFLFDLVIAGYLIGGVTLKSNLGYVSVVGTVLCSAELFWLFSFLAANPLIRAAILVLVFHLFVGLLPSSFNSKLAGVALRQYLVVASILFVILIQFL